MPGRKPNQLSKNEAYSFQSNKVPGWNVHSDDVRELMQPSAGASSPVGKSKLKFDLKVRIKVKEAVCRDCNCRNRRTNSSTIGESHHSSTSRLSSTSGVVGSSVSSMSSSSNYSSGGSEIVQPSSSSMPPTGSTESSDSRSSRLLRISSSDIYSSMSSGYNYYTPSHIFHTGSDGKSAQSDIGSLSSTVSSSSKSSTDEQIGQEHKPDHKSVNKDKGNEQSRN